MAQQNESMSFCTNFVSKVHFSGFVNCNAPGAFTRGNMIMFVMENAQKLLLDYYQTASRAPDKRAYTG